MSTLQREALLRRAGQRIMVHMQYAKIAVHSASSYSEGQLIFLRVHIDEAHLFRASRWLNCFLTLCPGRPNECQQGSRRSVVHVAHASSSSSSGLASRNVSGILPCPKREALSVVSAKALQHCKACSPSKVKRNGRS